MKRPKSPQETVDISRCTQIEGLPNYYANVERCEVANKFGYRIKVKVSGRKNGIKNYILYDNGKKCCISAARLMYAVQRGINPLKIPQSLVVLAIFISIAEICQICLSGDPLNEDKYP